MQQCYTLSFIIITDYNKCIIYKSSLINKRIDIVHLIVVSYLVDAFRIETVFLGQEDMRRPVHPLRGGGEDRQRRLQRRTLVLCNISDKNIRKRKIWITYCGEKTLSVDGCS